MNVIISILALLLITISQEAFTAGYKVQIYNGTGQIIDVNPGTGALEQPVGFEPNCKWANTNFNMGNADNWSDSTFGAWLTSINTARTVQVGEHRSFWCKDKKPKRWERRFSVRVDCDQDGTSYVKSSDLFARTHLSYHGNYVFTLNGSHCLPN